MKWFFHGVFQVAISKLQIPSEQEVHPAPDIEAEGRVSPEVQSVEVLVAPEVQEVVHAISEAADNPKQCKAQKNRGRPPSAVTASKAKHPNQHLPCHCS
jgi:hypothetical protein